MREKLFTKHVEIHKYIYKMKTLKEKYMFELQQILFIKLMLKKTDIQQTVFFAANN